MNHYNTSNNRSEMIMGLFESSSFGVAVFSSEGMLIANNDNYDKLVALSGEAFLQAGTSLFESSYLTDAEISMLKSGTTVKFRFGYKSYEDYIYKHNTENAYLKIEGKIFPANNHLGDADKTYVMILEDITKEYLQERILERRVANAEGSLLSSHSVAWEYVVSERLFYSFNEPVVNYGRDKTYSPEDFAKFTHPDDIPNVIPIVERMARGENFNFSFEIRMEVPNLAGNKYQYTIVMGGPKELDPVTGKVTKYVGSRLDATRTHNLYERLKDTLSLNNLIIKNSKVGLMFIDSSYMIKWETISSFLPEHLWSKLHQKGFVCHRQLTHFENCCSLCPLQKSMETGKIGMSETFIDNLAIRLTAIPISDDCHKGIILKVEDITQDIALKNAQIAKEKAEYSDSMKSMFIANMSHEIRTPLNAIIGFSELLIASKDPEEKAEFQKIILNNNELLLSIINDILDISRIENSKISFNIETVDINEILQNIEQNHTLSCPKKNLVIRFTNRVPGLSIQTDPAKIKQIINNLISNALKFTQHGLVEFGYDKQGEYLRFFVKDTGKGIPTENLESIFDRFVKLNNFDQGIGLGLSICKTIVERLNGEIGVTSEEGKGSEFWFTLPLKTPKRETTYQGEVYTQHGHQNHRIVN